MVISTAIDQLSGPKRAPRDSGLRSVPGSAGLPLVGQTLQILHDPVGTLLERYTRYGSVSWGRLLGRKVLYLVGPDAVEAVLTNRDKAFANGPGWQFFLGPFFDRGLMFLDFEEHHLHRRIMQQAFTGARMPGYLDAMNPTIEKALDQWEPAERFALFPALKQMTLDVATDVFIGGAAPDQADRINTALIDSVRGAAAFVRYPVPGFRWSKALAGRRVMERYFAEQLPAKRAGSGNDLFSELCHAQDENGEVFSDDDVINHMIFLLMAAHDTSTTTLTTMAYYLAKHPDWQQRCRDESAALGTQHLSVADLDRLTSLDLVMKESMRLIPPVPVVVRQTVKDTELLGCYVPGGMTVMVGLLPSHHLEDFWPDPETFDPERFAADRREDKVHRYAWAPFGGGVHKCIGLHFGAMEVKAVMHQMLLRFRWSVEEGYEPPWDWTGLPWPKDGLPLAIERI